MSDQQCEFVKIASPGPYPWYQCQKCKQIVEVRRAPDQTDEEYLARIPACRGGELVESLKRRRTETQARITTAHKEAEAAQVAAGATAAVAPPQRMPSLARQAWNLAESLASFVADGCHLVTAEQYRQRLEICDVCEARRENRCMVCGCRLSLKSRGRAFQCPLNRWPKVPAES